jgi:secreted PhoX family phosphatase
MTLDASSVRESETFEEVVSRRMARRTFLKGALGAAPLMAIMPDVLLPRASEAGPAAYLRFQAVPLDDGLEVVVAPGYQVQKFLRWGEPILRGAPSFDPARQSAAAQAQQFGYNCDFLQYFPLPYHRSGNPGHGLLCVNHEYTNPELMFPAFAAGGSSGPAARKAGLRAEVEAGSQQERGRKIEGRTEARIQRMMIA